MKGYVIVGVSALIFFLSPFALIIFLIKPSLLNSRINQNLSRKKIISLFAGLMLVSLVSIGIFADSTAGVEEKDPSVVESVLELDEQVLGETIENIDPISTPSSSPTTRSSPTVTPTPTSTPATTLTPTPVPTYVPAPTPTPVPTFTPVPTPVPAPVIIAPTVQPTAIPSTPLPATGYSCNCSKTCPNMSSCAEAYFQLNDCGCSRRDGDNDGVPCESICG